MKGQTYVILSLIFIILIAVFSVLNVSQVEVNYLFWSGSSPLIFVILFSVLLGGILTTVIGSKTYFSLKRQNKVLQAKVTQLEANSTESNNFESINTIDQQDITEEHDQL